VLWQGDGHPTHGRVPSGVWDERQRGEGAPLARVVASRAAGLEGEGSTLVEREVTNSREAALPVNILTMSPLGLPEDFAFRRCLSAVWRGTGSGSWERDLWAVAGRSPRVFRDHGGGSLLRVLRVGRCAVLCLPHVPGEHRESGDRPSSRSSPAGG